MSFKNCGYLLNNCHGEPTIRMQLSAQLRGRHYCHQYGKTNIEFRRQILLKCNQYERRENRLANFNCLQYSKFSSKALYNRNLIYNTIFDVNVNSNQLNSSKRRNLSSITETLQPYVDPKLSYAFGRSAEGLLYSTVGREFARKVAEAPNEVVFAFDAENKLITFRQLSHDVNKLTKSLITQFNVKKGDFVGVFAYNCYHWILVEFACSQIGAILTPINPSYKSHELAYVLKKGRVKCMFMPGPKSNQANLNNHMGVLQSEEIISMSRSGELKLEHVILMDSENEYKLSQFDFKLANCKLVDWSSTESDGFIFSSMEAAKQAGFNEQDNPIVLDPDYHVSPDDLFAVYYTSGTTGKPKGACVSQSTILNNVRFCQLRLRDGRPKDFRAISATTLPLFHIFAGVLNAIGPSVGNTMVVFPSYKYDIGAYVESIMRHQANLSVLTPTMLIDLIAYIEQNGITDLPLKMIQPGGASLPPELVTRAFKVLPNLEELRSGYGSTENGAVATFQTKHEPKEVRNFNVGPPIDFTEIRIVEPLTSGTNFKVLPLGQAGEIQTRGYNTMVEYLDDPEKTREVITPNRWYRTGDIGFMYPHGSVQINGRLKHMIIKGGENIYPDEVEQIIYKMDCIEEVHVIGIPDKRFGEQVCAWIKLKANYKESTTETTTTSAGDNDEKSIEIHKNDVIKFCKENMTYFKVPKYILFVKEFPMTPTKKAQSHLMVEETIKILGMDK